MLRRRTSYVYIMSSRERRVLYVGVTSDLERRVAQHRSGRAGAYSRRYQLSILLWYEAHASISLAIAREKQLKGGSRANKIRLIESLNPDWRDLSEELVN